MTAVTTAFANGPVMCFCRLCSTQIAEEESIFGFDDVVNEICTKLITRHTHVFGKDNAVSAEEALGQWEKNKKKEKNLDSYTAMLEDVPHYLPALMRSEKIQKKAGSVGFDWGETEPIYDKIAEEMTEVKEAVKNGKSDEIEEEYGDLLFGGRFGTSFEGYT